LTVADMITIHNKLNQSVKLVLRNAAGEDETVNLGPRGKHGPVDASCQTKRTKHLADRHHIKIRPA
jgi:hypothetical protein